MKFILLAMFVSFGFSPAHAGGFSSVVVCGNRALVVDQSISPRYVGRGTVMGYDRSYQVVLKNQQILADFISKNAIPGNAMEINASGEFVTQLVSDHGSNVDFYSVFAAGRTLTVKLRGNAVVMAVYAPSALGSRLLASFTFQDCSQI